MRYLMEVLITLKQYLPSKIIVEDEESRIIYKDFGYKNYSYG